MQVTREAMQIGRRYRQRLQLPIVRIRPAIAPKWLANRALKRTLLAEAGAGARDSLTHLAAGYMRSRDGVVRFGLYACRNGGHPPTASFLFANVAHCRSERQAIEAGSRQIDK
jgi:hypothetical protein